jgi:hypothetical protein
VKKKKNKKQKTQCDSPIAKIKILKIKKKRLNSMYELPKHHSENKKN